MTKKERLQLENELLFTCSKAQAINKYIDELEESSKLSELWCKSQEENRELQKRIDKAIEELTYMLTDVYVEDYDIRDKYWELLLEILKGGENNR